MSVKNLKTRVAAAATIVGLGGLTGIALSAGSQKSAPVAVKPLVRTKVIRRTIHVTKHVKPKHPMGAGAAGDRLHRWRRRFRRWRRHHGLILDRLRLLLLFVFAIAGDDRSQRRLDLRAHLGLALDAGRHPHQRLTPRLARRPASSQPRRYPHQRLAAPARAAATATARPVVTHTSGASAGSGGGSTTPVTTASSGGGGAGGGGEGGDHEGRGGGGD